MSILLRVLLSTVLTETELLNIFVFLLINEVEYLFVQSLKAVEGVFYYELLLYEDVTLCDPALPSSIRLF